MGSIVRDYEEKCTRKFDFLGSCPMNIAHKVKPCTLLYFLSTFFYSS